MSWEFFFSTRHKKENRNDFEKRWNENEFKCLLRVKLEETNLCLREKSHEKWQ